MDDPDLPELRAAAVEAAARLPLSSGAWEVLGDQLLHLLDDPRQTAAIAPVVRAAGRAPLERVRHRLVEIAGDTAHPGHGPARLLLAEVNLQALAGDVMAVLREPLTDATAHRLACVPLERVALAAARVPAGASPRQRWWTGVAAARLGEVARLDAAVRDLRKQNPPAAEDLRAVLPLPEELLGTWRRCSSGYPTDDALAAAWSLGAHGRSAADYAAVLAEVEPRLSDRIPRP